MTRRIKEGNEKQRQIQPVTSSLSVLHHLKHTEIQGWVEKRRGRKRQRPAGGEKGESKGRESGQASNLALR